MGPGLPKVTPSHGKDQWSSAPAAACLFSAPNFIFSSCVCLVKNANPATLIRHSHRDDGWIACLPTACNTSRVTAKGLNTFLHPPPVPGRDMRHVVLFPAGGDLSVCHISTPQCFFQTSYLLPSKPVPLQWSACICVKWDVFWLGIVGSDLPCLWYCETSVRSSVGKLDKDLGCIIPYHEVPCYMRYASSVTTSWLVWEAPWQQWQGRHGVRKTEWE